MPFEHRLTKPFYTAGQQNFEFWSIITRRGLYSFLFAFAGIWFVTDREFYSTVVVVLSMLVSFLVTYIIRNIVRRPRPKFDTDFVPMLKDWSFPSAHSAVAFSLATSISLLAFQLWISPFVWLGVVILFAAALVIAISRLAVGVHFLSDAIVGALIGIATSVIFIGL